jgi:hypothetical protein
VSTPPQLASNCFVTICVQCHNFQKRLCWMLSSLKQQTLRYFVVDVAHMVGNGRPSTESIIEFFLEQGLLIIARPYVDPHRFERRGYTRNDQLAGARTPWVWFADCDHVYHPAFMARLNDALELQSGEEMRVLSAGRRSSNVGTTSYMVDASIGESPVCVCDVFAKAKSLAPLGRRRMCGAGHTQIVRRHGIHNGVYVPEGKSRDWAWSTTKCYKTPSDVAFRRRCGGVVGLGRWFARNQIHLNHVRDSDVGWHIDDQR